MLKSLSAEIKDNAIRVDVSIGGASYSNGVALRNMDPSTVASGLRLIAHWIEELKK